MCISLPASLAAGLVGETAALYVLLRTPHRGVGAWMATYSLIQVYEAAAYAGWPLGDATLKRLLYAQGAVAAALFRAEGGIPSRALLVGALVVAYALDPERTDVARCVHACTWKRITWPLTVMYAALFAWALATPEMRPIDGVYLLTLAVAYTVPEERRRCDVVFPVVCTAAMNM